MNHIDENGGDGGIRDCGRYQSRCRLRLEVDTEVPGSMVPVQGNELIDEKTNVEAYYSFDQVIGVPLRYNCKPALRQSWSIGSPELSRTLGLGFTTVVRRMAAALEAATAGRPRC